MEGKVTLVRKFLAVVLKTEQAYGKPTTLKEEEEVNNTSHPSSNVGIRSFSDVRRRCAPTGT